jgi:hypothetical protein
VNSEKQEAGNEAVCKASGVTVSRPAKLDNYAVIVALSEVRKIIPTVYHLNGSTGTSIRQTLDASFILICSCARQDGRGN